MTNGNGNGKLKSFMEATDYISDVYKRNVKRAPMIKRSAEFYKRPIEEQLAYWHKLASSLNDACQQIQKERDELNAILFSKEAQLTQLKKQVEADRMMIHNQLDRENKRYQKLLEENQMLHRKTTEMEKDGGNKR